MKLPHQPVITRVGGDGRPYSEDFLNTLITDLQQLARDWEGAGGASTTSRKLTDAARMVVHIREEINSGDT